MTLNKQTQEIERLREWIREEGLRNDTCTYDILREVCSNCKCKRKPAPAGNEPAEAGAP